MPRPTGLPRAGRPRTAPVERREETTRVNKRVELEY
jgi:hypothetical protein